jgi:hypothetical protein
MIPANLSLFNLLPGGKLETISRDLLQTATQHRRLPARTDGLRFLGEGGAYTLHAPGLVALRRAIAAGWEP